MRGLGFHFSDCTERSVTHAGVGFLAVRFTVATLVMFALRPTCLRGMTPQGLRRGAGLGVVLGVGYITQTYGCVLLRRRYPGSLRNVRGADAGDILADIGEKGKPEHHYRGGVSHSGIGAAQPARLERGYRGIADASLRDIFCDSYRGVGRMVG